MKSDQRQMLEDVVISASPPEKFSTEGISSPSPIALEFCDDSDFFLDNLENSDLPSFAATTSAPTATSSSTTVTTSSGGGEGPCCYVDDNSFAFDPATITAFFDSQQPYDSQQSSAANVTYHLPVTQVYNQEQFHPALCTDGMAVGCYSSFTHDSSAVQVPMGHPGQYEFLAPLPPSCSYMDPAGTNGYYPDAMGMGFFSRSMMIGLESEMVADCGGGAPMPETVQRVFSSNNMQMMGDCQNLVTTKPPPATDISALDNVCRLTAEQRKEKIHRYLKKRNERNFSKKIKYACRKTLADNRPRVRGRFAKNDELSETTIRAGSSNHEYDDYEVTVKEDQDALSPDPNAYHWCELLEIQLRS